MKCEKGYTLIGVMVALLLLGIVAVAFLSGMATASRVLFIADERATAESLARSEMEYIKNLPYEYEATVYGLDPAITLNGYTISVLAAPLRDPDDGVQRIKVTVAHHGKPILTTGDCTLEDYKVDR